jgi:acetate kinase
LSGGISDMRELTAAANRSAAVHPSAAAVRGPDPGSAVPNQAIAAQAIAIFCRAIAKTVAGYAAVLGGIDTLVFTGGIGEHSVPVRETVCRQLAFLGITLDAEANQRHATVISQPASPISNPITVQILPADEDGRIAHHVRNLLAQ